MSARAAWAACVLALNAQGCAWSEGSGFATLSATEVSARIEGDDASAPAELTTNLGYVVQLESAELYVEDVLFERGDAGSEDAHFDPAHPPEGYAQCHAGHCHSDDGRLVPYAEIEGESAAGGAHATVLSIPVFSRLDLLGGGVLHVRQAAPSRELPLVELQRITLRAGSLHLRGSVRAGPGGETLPASLSVLVDLEVGAAVHASVHVDIDRDTPADVHAVVEAVVPHTLLDGLDFAGLAVEGAVSLSDVETTEAEPVLDALAESELRFELH
jgi:hypothetical protein